MSPSSSLGRGGMTRRGFLLGAATGLVAGSGLTWAGLQAWQRLSGELTRTSFTGRTSEVARPVLGMPGRFPGRVIEVTDPTAVRTDWTIDGPCVSRMIDRGMKELTGADAAEDAWRCFFQPGDVVGIKVNPTGRRPLPGEGGRNPNAVGAISNPEVLLKVVVSLKNIGIKPSDIIVFERYAEEFCEAGYAQLLNERDLAGVRWYASSASGSGLQVDILGFDNGRDACSPSWPGTWPATIPMSSSTWALPISATIPETIAVSAATCR